MGGTKRRPSTPVVAAVEAEAHPEAECEMPLLWRIIQGTTSEIEVVPWVVLSRCDLTPAQEGDSTADETMPSLLIRTSKLVVARPSGDVNQG